MSSMSSIYFYAEYATRVGHVTVVHTCALPISASESGSSQPVQFAFRSLLACVLSGAVTPVTSASHGTPELARSRSINVGLRSEEHTSELQSRGHLVCRLLLEKNKD